jgi:hypothetical protein
MFDFVLGIGLAGLAVRGWLRGFVREVLDLVSLVLGIFVALLLSARSPACRCDRGLSVPRRADKLRNVREVS